MYTAEQFAREYYYILDNTDLIDEIHEGDLTGSSIDGNVMRFIDATGFDVVVTVEVELHG